MNGEELEFQICQYLDGTLPPAQRSALEALLERDESARQMLAEHRKLDAAMKTANPLPAMRWDQLADRFAKAVAGDAEQLEQAVVRYVDGDLPAEESASLKERLAADPHGSSLLRQHSKVLSGLRSMPLPRIRWKNLAEHLSEAVADLADPKPIKLFGPWMRTVAGLAVAACMLLVSGLALHQLFPSHPVAIGPQSTPTHVQPSPFVIGPEVADARGVPVTDISISAGGGASSADSAEYADGIVVVQPSRGLIATSASPVQDIQMPY